MDAFLSTGIGVVAGIIAFLAIAIYANRVKGLPLNVRVLILGNVREINVWGVYIVLAPHIAGAVAAYYTVLMLGSPPIAVLLMALWLAYMMWLYERLKERVNPCLDCPECQRQDR